MNPQALLGRLIDRERTKLAVRLEELSHIVSTKALDGAGRYVSPGHLEVVEVAHDHEHKAWLTARVRHLDSDASVVPEVVLELERVGGLYSFREQRRGF